MGEFAVEQRGHGKHEMLKLAFMLATERLVLKRVLQLYATKHLVYDRIRGVVKQPVPE